MSISMNTETTNSVYKRPPSILKKNDQENPGDLKSNLCDDVTKSKRRSKRVSFGQQQIREIAKVSEITSNWADSLSSDEGLTGLSDIGNLTSLRGKRSFGDPQNYQQAGPSNNNIFTPAQGFKFFDNSKLTSLDKIVDKENVEATAETSLFAKDFLSSFKSTESQIEKQPSITHPDVNPPSYNEIAKLSHLPPAPPLRDDKCTLETNINKIDSDVYLKQLIPMVADNVEVSRPLRQEFEEGSSNVPSSIMNQTNADIEDMEITCAISQHSITPGVVIAEETVRRTGIVEQEDVEMVCATSMTSTSACSSKVSEQNNQIVAVHSGDICSSHRRSTSASVELSGEDMEITCAVPLVHLDKETSAGLSNNNLSADDNHLVDFQRRTSVGKTSHSDSFKSDDMDFTCLVRQTNSVGLSQSKNNNFGNAELVTEDSGRNATFPKNSASVSNTLEMDDSLDYTCVASEKSLERDEFHKDIAGDDKKTINDSMKLASGRNATFSKNSASVSDTQEMDDGLDFTCMVSQKSLERDEFQEEITRGDKMTTNKSVKLTSVHMSMADASTPLVKTCDRALETSVYQLGREEGSAFDRSTEKISYSVDSTVNDSVFKSEFANNSLLRTTPIVVDTDKELITGNVDANLKIGDHCPSLCEAVKTVPCDRFSGDVMDCADNNLSGKLLTQLEEDPDMATSSSIIPAAIPPVDVSCYSNKQGVGAASTSNSKNDQKMNFHASEDRPSGPQQSQAIDENGPHNKEVNALSTTGDGAENEDHGYNVTETIAKDICAAMDSENPVLTSHSDILLVDEIMEKVGLPLPKVPWNRESVPQKFTTEQQETGLCLMALFESKFWTPSQNDIRESAIGQIEDILGWFESGIELLKKNLDSRSGPSFHHVSSEILQNENLQKRLDLLKDSCLARGKVYWKQMKTKLYKGLSKALDEYISAHLQKVCSKFGNANELLELASTCLHESDTGPRPDAPTAQQEDELKRLDTSLNQLNSEIEKYNIKDKSEREYEERLALLGEDVILLSKQWNDALAKTSIQQRQLLQFQRTTGRRMLLETDEIFCVKFLNETISLSVELNDKLSPWNWDNKVKSYSTQFEISYICTTEESNLYSMIHCWWTAMLCTTKLKESYPNLRAVKMFLGLLTDLEVEFKNLLSLSEWISTRLVCKYSTIPEDRKFVVSFLPPRLGTDGFRIIFTFEQLHDESKSQDILTRGLSPTSWEFVPGRKLWKDLQLFHAKEIINSVCPEKLCIRTIVDAFLKHVNYRSQMFDKE